jgi:myo-inositol-1(or 4)-monophosphatase
LTLTYYLEFVRDSLLAANAVVNEALRDGRAALPRGRGAFGDLTIEVDKAVEDEVISLADRRLPATDIISEELGVRRRPGARLSLLMDPVDGSTNAKRGVSLFSTSIALADGGLFRDIFVAGVIDHVTGRMIWGSRGSVYEDWMIAKPSELKELEDALIAFDSKAYKVPKSKMKALDSLMTSTKFPRMISTAALETAYVATGRLDAFIAPFAQLRSFDCLPSIFLVLEAGGKVELEEGDLASTPLDGSRRVNYVAAANAALMKLIRKKLR